jgi:hypothetical protein
MIVVTMATRVISLDKYISVHAVDLNFNVHAEDISYLQ